MISDDVHANGGGGGGGEGGLISNSMHAREKEMG